MGTRVPAVGLVVGLNHAQDGAFCVIFESFRQ